MKKVGIFLITSARSPGKCRKAWYKYMLICDGHVRDGEGQVNNTTGNRLALQCAVVAAKKIVRPAMITFFTDCHYLAEGQRQLAIWKKNGWKKPNGQELKNLDLWQQLEELPGQDNILNHPEYMPKPEIAPAQKTEEQKYNEEQAKIDRETQKKLQEQEDQEKMEHLPSDEGPRVHQIRLAGNYYDLVADGTKTFELRKNDRGYRAGDHLELMEFKDGRNTGRMIKAKVTYILEDYTGLEEGYCIMAITVTAAD